MTSESLTAVPALSKQRWIQLVLGIIAMMIISNPQYVWTLFVKPLQTGLNASLATIQVTFSILIVVQTWLSPLQGYLIERFGPRKLISVGAGLSGIGWILAGYSNSVTMLYLTYGLLCGIGTGIVYVGIIGQAVKWFPDKRGLATGLVASGYGLGALLTTFPINTILGTHGATYTLVFFGILLGLLGVLIGLGMKDPPTDLQKQFPPKTSIVNSDPANEASPSQMIRSPIFWTLFVMMTMMATGGLMVISQFAAFTRDFGVADVLVWGLPALPLALTLDRLTNGCTRPIFGWISDKIGRENTMALAFVLEALSIMLLVHYRSNATLFVLLSGVVFFAWGEIFTLFPSTLTDIFGTRSATTNYGILYLAQGVGSVLGGPVAALIHDATGSWLPIFATIIGMDLLTAFFAVAVLKPMRRSLRR